MLVRLSMFAGAVAALLVGTVVAGQDEALPVPVELPALISDDADRIYLNPHGDALLMTASGKSFDSLWRLAGGEAAHVEFENGNRVVGQNVYVQLGGNPAIVEFSPGGGLEQQYVMVRDGVASELTAGDGKRFIPGMSYAFRHHGVTLFAVMGDDDLSSFHVLVDDRVLPLMDPGGKGVRARMVLLFACADGRIRAVVWKPDGEYAECFLHDNKLSPIPEPELPGEAWTPVSSFFPSGGRVVTCVNVESGLNGAALTDGEARWVMDESDRPLRHKSLVVREVGDELYLFGRDFESDDADETRVYVLREGVARRLTGEEITPRAVTPFVVGDNLFAVNHLKEDGRELLRVTEEGLERIERPDGKSVNPTGEFHIGGAGSVILAEYRDGDATGWGIIEGTAFHPVAPGRKWHAPEYGNWAWEIGGRVYIRWDEPADGQQYAWFGYIDAEHGLVPLETSIGVLKGDRIEGVHAEGRLYVSYRALKGGASLFALED